MKTADPELMRAINRFTVLDIIRRCGQISRVEIGTQTELSPTTISAITGSLLDDGLIVSRHEGDLRSNASRGRPRVMLALNPEAARVVGVKIAASRISVSVTDFQGDVLAQLSLPVGVHRLPAEIVVDLVEDGVRRCVLDARLSLAEINTIALSLAGIIEHANGKVRASPILRDGDASLSDALQQRLGITTIVESDANAVAMGQRWFGSARNIDDFVLVSIEDTLGLAVMHNGQLFRGARGLSLTLGDMIMGVGPQHARRLSEIAGERAILAGSAGDRHMDEAIRLGQGMALAAEHAAAGDAGLVRNAAEAGAALGTAIANLVGLFAPPKVILMGSTLALGEHLLGPLRSAFAAAVPEALSTIADIVIDVADDHIWARGAAAVALSELYGSPWSTTGPARPAPFGTSSTNAVHRKLDHD